MLQPELAFSGRTLSQADLELIREVTRDFSNLSLTELSKTVCKLLDWKRATEKLKYEEWRALLERLRDQGLVTLPGLRPTAAPGPRRIVSTAQSDAQAPVTGSAGEFDPLILHLVQASNPTLSPLFKQYVDRYHYLGYRIAFGAHLRYLVESQQLPGRFIACLQFSSPAWKMAPRDAWIGWSAEQRKRNLQFIVSNSRFLVLPWVSVRGLASKILSLAARRLPQDWNKLYTTKVQILAGRERIFHRRDAEDAEVSQSGVCRMGCLARAFAATGAAKARALFRNVSIFHVCCVSSAFSASPR